jgi:hypothetical protein
MRVRTGAGVGAGSGAGEGAGVRKTASMLNPASSTRPGN